jgi:hypothetical protein
MTRAQRELLAKIARGIDVPGVLSGSHFSGSEWLSLRKLLAAGLVRGEGRTPGGDDPRAAGGMACEITEAGHAALLHASADQ